MDRGETSLFGLSILFRIEEYQWEPREKFATLLDMFNSVNRGKAEIKRKECRGANNQ